VDVAEPAGSTVAQFTAAGAASIVEAVDSMVVAGMAAVATGNFAN
jgi:hypothetical protein